MQIIGETKTYFQMKINMQAWNAAVKTIRNLKDILVGKLPCFSEKKLLNTSNSR